MTYSLADSCEPPPPAAADAIEQPFQDLPPGLDFFCGEVFPTECVELTGQGYAELTASSDRIVIDFLGDDDRLADRCGEDLGVVIVVVSPEATEIDPALPVFFNGQRIEAQG